MGVDLFFVLSGFLITTLIIEKSRLGEFSYLEFYKRRFLRLTPPLAMMLCIYLIAAPFLWDIPFINHLRDSAVSITYLSDYARAYFDIPDILRHTWSLAVEEHYYLIWPLLLLTIASGRGLLRTAVNIILLAILATLWRKYELYYSDNSFMNVYQRFDTRLSGLLIGSAAACVSMAISFSERATRLAAMFSTAYLIYAILGLRRLDFQALYSDLTYIEIAAAVLIISIQQNRKSDTASILSIHPLPYLGKLSYGIYLYHYPISYYLRKQQEIDNIFLTTALLSILLSAISYHSIEAYFRRARHAATKESIENTA
ncbi:acyltransferase [Pseudomonas sp. RW407]|uniref:acyltransferase family protein n=1 Tax=Pseudomonas sp. RW407 TaxID=2202894 RepID=UPI000D6F9DE5|nr:acyltransferase [Pseudomonas sp. RW407]PWU32185.1 acyltransferase [Pseudomonas sp. RW407]